MTDFLRDLFGRPGTRRTVILMEPDATGTPRRYEVRPSLLILTVAGGIAVLAVVLSAIAALGPGRLLPAGPSADELRHVAETNAARATALEDSLTLQSQQIVQLQALIMGESADLRSSDLGPPPAPLPTNSGGPLPADAASRPPSLYGDGDAIAFPLRSLGPAGSGDAPRDVAAVASYLDGLRLPAAAPVDGVLSRGFNAARGHFGVDYAATQGTPVRVIGEGYVVFADWTHDGGHTIAVQHPGGYLSIYKHNSRLLKRVGERVRAREPVALSGDTGEITSGPHLHVEVWRDGLAQDPGALFLVP